MVLDTFMLVAAQYDSTEDPLADCDAVEATCSELHDRHPWTRLSSASSPREIDALGASEG